MLWIITFWSFIFTSQYILYWYRSYSKECACLCTYFHKTTMYMCAHLISSVLCHKLFVIMEIIVLFVNTVLPFRFLLPVPKLLVIKCFWWHAVKILYLPFLNTLSDWNSTLHHVWSHVYIVCVCGYQKRPVCTLVPAFYELLSLWKT